MTKRPAGHSFRRPGLLFYLSKMKKLLTFADKAGIIYIVAKRRETKNAAIAQQAEHILGKDEVVRSNRISSSTSEWTVLHLKSPGNARAFLISLRHSSFPPQNFATQTFAGTPSCGRAGEILFRYFFVFVGKWGCTKKYGAEAKNVLAFLRRPCYNNSRSQKAICLFSSVGRAPDC